MGDHWAELRTLFDELVELEPTDRDARLREIGSRDLALCARLEAMLAADAAAAERKTPLQDYEALVARSVLAATSRHAAAPGARTQADPLGLLGTAVGRYRIDALLGAGGMGVVYRATDLRLGRVAALKFLPPVLSLDTQAKERFLHEARAASSLDHPNVCTIYEADETAGGTLYIAMAFYEGETLRTRLERGPLAVGEALDLAAQAARGLATAHGRGLVHRDIKPANLLVTADGVLKILDFGVSKAADVGLTSTEQRPGTAAYMAPEQARGEAVDGRADLWSLGVVLYELLTGKRPAGVGGAASKREPRGPPSSAHGEKPSAAAWLAPSRVRAEVPESADALVERLLAYEPEDRPAHAEQVVDALERIIERPKAKAITTRTGHAGIFASLVRNHPGWFVSMSMAALVVGLGTGMLAVRGLRTDPLAPAALAAQIEQLAATGRHAGAFELAERAEDRGGPPLPDSIWFEIADWLTVSSEPEGAQVFVLRYAPGASDPAQAGEQREWQALGTTPLDSVRLPRGDYIVRVERDGFAPAERSASSALLRVTPDLPQNLHRMLPARDGIGDQPGIDMRLHFRLLPSGDVPEGMVFVPGGDYQIVSPDLAGSSATLDDFFVDRFEVTNARFAEFVHAGGYTDPRHWRELVDADPQGWRATLQGFRDRTGLPAPRNWSGQAPPHGREEDPVTAVSWYEAAAYCRFRGRRLPTLAEWEKTARDGLIARVASIMPWGHQSPGDGLALRANFSSTGTAPVGAHPFGISPYGAHDMAGNAKEWLRNPTEHGRAVTGGSWEDPIYVFPQVGGRNPLFRSPSLGFRCATLTGSGDPAADQGAGLVELDRPVPVYESVDEQGFQTLLSHYRYDRRPLAAEVIGRTETPGWIREKIAFNGPAGGATDRIIAYLYLPRAAQSPFHTLVFTPGVGAFLGNSVPFEVEWIMAPLIRAGRAVFSVVMSGMAEREWQPGRPLPEPSSVEFRNLMVLHATELRIGLDYLETRPDIDAAAIGYVAVSLGAGSRLPWAAVDERLRAVVLIGGGIDERMHPTLPEASNINFAPYIRAPTLLLNGRNDEESPWRSRGLPLWNLLSEPKDLVLVEGAGHIPPPEDRIPAIVDWLDRTLGPVRY